MRWSGKVQVPWELRGENAPQVEELRTAMLSGCAFNLCLERFIGFIPEEEGEGG